ncbi:MAG: hypothetical protein AB7Q81_18900 [Gammaproteobacteria bacterium]
MTRHRAPFRHRARHVLALLLGGVLAGEAQAIVVPPAVDTVIAFDAGIAPCSPCSPLYDADLPLSAYAVGSGGGTNNAEGAASFSANALHAMARVFELAPIMNGAGRATLAMTVFDTYTLHSDAGATGPVPFQVLVDVTGLAGPSPATGGDKLVTWSFTVGQRRTSADSDPGSHLQPGTLVLNESRTACGIAACPGLTVIDETLVGNAIRDVGVPFELGFRLFLFAANGFADFSHSAVVSFALPAGYSITAENGFGVPSAVPLPAALPLVCGGLLALGGMARSRYRGRAGRS